MKSAKNGSQRSSATPRNRRPDRTEFFDHMYADMPASLKRQRDSKRTTSLGQFPRISHDHRCQRNRNDAGQAVTDALACEMRLDDRVIILVKMWDSTVASSARPKACKRNLGRTGWWIHLWPNLESSAVRLDWR